MLLGHAWECLRWETNLGNVLLDPSGFGKVLAWYFDTSLHQLYSNRLAENFVLGVDHSFGIIFIIAAISAVFIKQNSRFLKWPLHFAAICLTIIVFSSFYSKNFYIGILLENAAQILTPVILIYITRNNNNRRLVGLMKWSIAFTFFGHGLFAIGYYPQPGYFIDMMIKGFDIHETLARNVLIVFGILDFIFAISIFIPKLLSAALIYGILWGFITAIARITTSFNTDFLDNWIEQYLFAFMIRVPHFLIPLILWIEHRKSVNSPPSQ
ncbi:MAG: hypothetical protein P8M05_05650 [Flavobacteriales bacterium]|nr:hypothetical protein [Flavobacteriales bacterium]